MPETAAPLALQLLEVRQLGTTLRGGGAFALIVPIARQNDGMH